MRRGARVRSGPRGDSGLCKHLAVIVPIIVCLLVIRGVLQVQGLVFGQHRAVHAVAKFKTLKDEPVAVPNRTAFTHFKCHNEINGKTQDLALLRLMLRPPQMMWAAGKVEQSGKRRLLTFEGNISAPNSSLPEAAAGFAHKSPALYKPLSDLACDKFTVAPDLPVAQCNQDAFAPYAMDLALDVVSVAASPAEPHCNGLFFTELSNDTDGAVDLRRCPGAVSYGKQWASSRHAKGSFTTTMTLAADRNIPGVESLWSTCSIAGVGCFENFRIRAVPLEKLQDAPVAHREGAFEPILGALTSPPPHITLNDSYHRHRFMVMREAAGDRYLTGYGGDGGDWLSLVESDGCVSGTVCDSIAFEPVPTSITGRFQIRCVKTGKFLRLSMQGRSNWVFKCAGTGSLRERHELGPADLFTLSNGTNKTHWLSAMLINTSILLNTSTGQQAHINLVKSKHIRGHGNVPLQLSPAGPEVSAKLKLEWVTRAQIDSGNAAAKMSAFRPAVMESAQHPSVLYIVFDSLSTRKFKQYFPLTSSTLAKLKSGTSKAKARAFSFKRTSTFGKNTDPNLPPMFDEWKVPGEALRFPNVFDTWRRNGGVPSFFKDSCAKTHCTSFKSRQHKICGHLSPLCSFGSEVQNLFANNPVPGCMGGRFWAESHRDYINSFWKSYRQRKFHVSIAWGGHSNHAQIAVQHDAVFNKLINEIIETYSDTLIFIGSDHGYHFGMQQSYNNFIPGEHQHRNPVLKVIIPEHMFQGDLPKFDANVIADNELKLVSHLDMHATLVDLAGTNTFKKGVSGSSRVAYNLLQERIPAERTCLQATIPKEWCPCFREKKAGECTVNPWNGCANFTAAQLLRFERVKKVIAEETFDYDKVPANEFGADPSAPEMKIK